MAWVYFAGGTVLILAVVYRLLFKRMRNIPVWRCLLRSASPLIVALACYLMFYLEILKSK